MIFFAVSIGIKHPDPVVETSSLASVEPSNIWYKLSLPENIIDNGELSALQLEAVTYACQRHDIILPSKDRAGFLIGKYSRIFNFIIKSKWVLFHLCIYLDLYVVNQDKYTLFIVSGWLELVLDYRVLIFLSKWLFYSAPINKNTGLCQ